MQNAEATVNQPLKTKQCDRKCVCSETFLTCETGLFGFSGLQNQQGVYCHSGSAAVHCQRFLEDDLGTESERHRNGDQLCWRRSGEFAEKDLCHVTGKIFKWFLCQVILICYLLHFYWYDTEELLFVLDQVWKILAWGWWERTIRRAAGHDGIWSWESLLDFKRIQLKTCMKHLKSLWWTRIKKKKVFTGLNWIMDLNWELIKICVPWHQHRARCLRSAQWDTSTSLPGLIMVCRRAPRPWSVSETWWENTSTQTVAERLLWFTAGIQLLGITVYLYIHTHAKIYFVHVHVSYIYVLANQM